jgi:hypothetical protein
METPLIAILQPENSAKTYFTAREPNYILVGTALFFVIPCILAYRVKQYAISICCLLILASSIVFHQNPTEFTFWFDQVMIVVFTLIVGRMVLKKSLWLLLAIVCILAYAYLIYYGPLNSACARHPDKTVSSLWHGTLHIIPACGLSAFLYV